MDHLTAPFSRTVFRALLAFLTLERAWPLLPRGAIAFHLMALAAAGALAIGFRPRMAALALLGTSSFGDALELARPLSLQEALSSSSSAWVMAADWLGSPGRAIGAVGLLWIAAFDSSGSLERFEWLDFRAGDWLRGRRPSSVMVAAVFSVPAISFAAAGRWPQATLASGFALLGAHRPFRAWAGLAAVVLVSAYALMIQTDVVLYVLCAFASFGRAWCPPYRSGDRPVAFFDPEREFYGRIADVLLLEDRLHWIKFCSLASERAKTELNPRAPRDAAPFALKSGADVWRGSAGLIKAFESLGGWWRIVAYPLSAIPERTRDDALELLEEKAASRLSKRERPASERERRRFLE